MNQLAKCVVAHLAILPVVVFAQNAQTIYKSVDESGRVTYANSPIKGGAKVALEPLTVLPSLPSAAMVSLVQPTAARIIPVAKVASVSSPAYPIVAVAAVANSAAPPTLAPSASVSAVPPPTTVATLVLSENIQLRARQQRADTRQRILHSEIQTEEISLEGARLALAEERRRSGDMRAMQSALTATAATLMPQKAPGSADVRADIERHFERVRNLQDQVAMHEVNIAELREELISRK